MNKKGFVIGNAILSIVTIIVIVFIMGTFVFISSAIAALKKPEVPKTTASSLDKNDLLFQFIEVKLKNDQTQTLMIYDAIRLHESDQIEKQELKNALDQLQQKTGNCYFISYQSYFYNGAQWGPGGSVISDREVFRTENLLPIEIKLEPIELPINDRTQYKIETYFGPCK